MYFTPWGTGLFTFSVVAQAASINIAAINNNDLLITTSSVDIER